MTTEDINKYLEQGRMMQVATVSGGQPWVCTVYFVHDENLNLYWLSLPTRRHSQEITEHPKTAVAVPIKYDQPVVGLQAEGFASMVDNNDSIAKVMKLYVARYNAGKEFYNNFISGKSKHKLYKFTPKKFVIFDELNYKDNPRQEFVL